MVVEPITTVTLIAVFLLVGSILSWFADKIRLPDVLLLLLSGMVFGLPAIAVRDEFRFSTAFTASISIIALALIIFGSTAKIKLRELDSFSLRALKLTFIFTVLHLSFFTVAAHFIAGFSWWFSLLLATILSGTSPDVLLTLIGDCKHKLVELLKLESLFNTPLTVVLPFIVLDLMAGLSGGGVTEQFLAHFGPFLTTIVAGIGAGVVVALILLKIMERAYRTTYGYLATLVAVLLTYVLAENLGGNGVLAVTTLGLFFGNSAIKEKQQLLGFENLLAKALYIFVFMLLGSLIIDIPLSSEFIYSSLSLFAIYLAIRFASVWITMRGDNTVKEMAYATLNAAKGVGTATVVFTFAFLVPNTELIRNYSLAIILYSIILAAVTGLFSNYFINIKTVGAEKKPAGQRRQNFPKK